MIAFLIYLNIFRCEKESYFNIYKKWSSTFVYFLSNKNKSDVSFIHTTRHDNDDTLQILNFNSIHIVATFLLNMLYISIYVDDVTSGRFCMASYYIKTFLLFNTNKQTIYYPFIDSFISCFFFFSMYTYIVKGSRSSASHFSI